MVVAKTVADFLYYEGYEVRIIELAMISREMAQAAPDEQYICFFSRHRPPCLHTYCFLGYLVLCSLLLRPPKNNQLTLDAALGWLWTGTKFTNRTTFEDFDLDKLVESEESKAKLWAIVKHVQAHMCKPLLASRLRPMSALGKHGDR